MELLLANNANINVQGGSERVTVLHEAVSNENSDELMIKFLLENGADPQIQYVLNSALQTFLFCLYFEEIKMAKLQLIL